MGTKRGSRGHCVDLHIHTVFSDGTFTPEEVVKRAKAAGLQAISITDHDSVEGVEEGMKAGAELGVEVLSGLELSAWAEGDEIHILGYLVDHRDGELLATLRGIREFRVRRADEMVWKLSRMGICLDLEEVLKEAGLGAVGRPHVAEVLVRKGYARDYEEAFLKFVGDGRPAWVAKLKTPPREVFAIIKRAGGIPVLAHPGLEGKDHLIPRLAEEGLEGLEVWYGRGDELTVTHYQELALRCGLLTTGGSDCHGARGDGPTLGRVKLPYSLVERLREFKSQTVRG